MNRTFLVNLKVHPAKSQLQKIVGLIGPDLNKSIFLETRFGIHTFGMRFPIDVLVLDINYQVVKLKQNLFPNRLFFWNPKFNRLVELPAGIIKKKRITRGSIIKLKLIS